MRRHTRLSSLHIIWLKINDFKWREREKRKEKTRRKKRRIKLSWTEKVRLAVECIFFPWMCYALCVDSDKWRLHNEICVFASHKFSLWTKWNRSHVIPPMLHCISVALPSTHAHVKALSCQHNRTVKRKTPIECVECCSKFNEMKWKWETEWQQPQIHYDLIESDISSYQPPNAFSQLWMFIMSYFAENIIYLLNNGWKLL